MLLYNHNTAHPVNLFATMVELCFEIIHEYFRRQCVMRQRNEPFLKKQIAIRALNFLTLEMKLSSLVCNQQNFIY